MSAEPALHAHPASWPEPPGEAAFIGFAGRVRSLVDPYTEADPVAVLAHLLAIYACAVGDGPHSMVGATRHPVRIFPVLVGRTSKARKGDSAQGPLILATAADPGWAESRVMGGLSTGEGLIYAVRDPIEKLEKGEPILVDAGVLDKRLLALDPEFARVLRVMTRQGNTLSAVLRAAWDTGTLRVMTKTSPATATGAHIVVVGHITAEELRRELDDVSIANGLANRFTWLAVSRSKELPEPEPFQGPEVEKLGRELGDLLSFGRSVGLLERDPEAKELWQAVYSDLSRDRDGLAGSLLARAEAQVLRISMLYALLDRSTVVRSQHLLAALEVWAYAERSVDYIFADATGYPMADVILKTIRQSGRLTRTQLRDLFGRNAPAGAVEHALALLLERGLARCRTEETGGRPAEVWEAA